MNVPKPIFEERLTPSVSIILALSLSGPMVLLAALPFGPVLAFTLAVLVPISLILGAFAIAPVIRIDESFTRGRITLPLGILGTAEIFKGEEARLERGPTLDARARLAIRGDIDPVVKIQINDELDPTPYLLVSTRKPEELVAALSADRS
jgi:hypothetical protein